MPGHTVRLGEPRSEGYLEFPSKKAARIFLKEMLGRYCDGEPIREPDSSSLRNLLERHPNAQYKIGCGVKHFFRAHATEGTDCFWLERNDGSRTDFSYISCVDARGKSLYQEFAEACRQAVQPELTRGKKEHFETHGDSEGKVECEITGRKVALHESHLDHKKPMTFQVIVHTFIRANKVEITPEMLSRGGDGEFATTFADKDIESRFKIYHASVAVLRIISANANLRLAGSERMIPPKRPVLL